MLFFVSAFIIIDIVGCAKEYSYERGDTTIIRDSTLIPDTITNPAINLTTCVECIDTDSDTIDENRWSFKYNGVYLCGILDTAIVNVERTGFTFFGPSACSRDTGLIITAYLNNVALDEDKINLKLEKVSFEYYDNVTPSDVFVSKTLNEFTLTIDTYTHLTRLATGTFTGYVYTADNKQAFIASGKFKIKLI
jgi:hypothetical protein